MTMPTPSKGKVFLVGAGPGDPELLTLKAFRALKAADVVLHDELIGPEILALVPKTAQLRSVGKRCGKKSVRQEEINALLVQFALLGLKVVRLKGGDPLLFGRAGEEIQALRQAGIEVEVIPGITSAFAAAASAQIPLTHREKSSALVILTGHHSASGLSEWPASLSPKATIVVYMPGYDYAVTAQRLIAAGIESSTPCAVISRAASSAEQVFRTTLQALPQAPQLAAPTLLIVGEVVALASHASLLEHGKWLHQSDDYPIAPAQLSAQADSQEQPD
jgi:uroporphyrin-III C-methyltransferase